MIRYITYLVLLLFGSQVLLLAQENDDSEIMDLLVKANEVWQSDMDSVYYYAHEAHEKALAIQDTVLIARSCYFKGLSLSQRKEYDAAFDVVQYNLKYKEKLPPVILGDTYNLIGTLYDQKQERDKAISSYLQAIDIYTKENKAK